MSSGSRGRVRALAVLLLLAALLRAFVILAPGADLYALDGSPDFEELLRGVAAQELIDGPLLPVQDYQVNHFWGGSLVVSMVAVPFFELLGPNLLALRTSPLAIHVLAVALAFLILDRYAGRRAAWIAGLLMAVPPAGYSLTSSSTLSLHTETNAVSLALFLAYLVYRERRSRAGRSPCCAALVGVLGGFGIWFAYGLSIPFAIVVGFELLRDKAFFLRRDGAFLLAGFLLGLAPWIRYQWVYDVGGAVVYGQGLEQQLLTDPLLILGKVKMLLLQRVPGAFWFRDTLGADGELLGGAAALTLGCFALWAVWARRREIAAPLAGLRTLRAVDTRVHPAALAAAFVVLYFLAYSLSGFGILRTERPKFYRYIMPFWPYLAILAACGLDALAELGRPARAAAAGVTALFVLAFGVATVRLCDTTRWMASLHEPATTRELLARFVFRRCGDDLERLERVSERLAGRSLEERDVVLFSLACGYRSRLVRAQDDAQRESWRAALDLLHATVAAPQRAYFEAPDLALPGARAPKIYRPSERALFWTERGDRPAPPAGDAVRD